MINNRFERMRSVGVWGVLAYLAFQLFLSRAGFHYEEFRDLQVVQGLFAGRSLYGDMDWIYGPLYPWLLGAFFRLTDLPLEILTVRSVAVFVGAAGFYGAYSFGRRFMSPLWSVLASFLACFIFLPPQPTYNHHLTGATVLVELGLLARYSERPSRWIPFCMAIATSVGCLTKPLPGGLGLFLSTLACLAYLGGRLDHGRTWRDGMLYIASVVVLIVLAYTPIVLRDGWSILRESLWPITLRADHEGLSRFGLPPYLDFSVYFREGPRLFPGSFPAPAQIAPILVNLMGLADLVGVLWGLSRLSVSRVGRRTGDLAIPMLLLVAVPASSETLIFGRTNTVHHTGRAASILLYCAAAHAASRVIRGERGSGRRRAFGALSTGLLMVSPHIVHLATFKLVPVVASLVAPRAGDVLRGRFTATLDLDGLRGVRVLPETKELFETFVGEIHARVAEGDKVAVTDNYPLVSFLLAEANLFFPTMHLYAHPGRTWIRGPDGEDVLAMTVIKETLRRGRPRFVVKVRVHEPGNQPGDNAEFDFGSGDSYRRVLDLGGRVSWSADARLMLFERIDPSGFEEQSAP